MKAALVILAALGLSGCPGDPPTSSLDAADQAVAACAHRGGISQVDSTYLITVCRDGSLHRLRNVQ